MAGVVDYTHISDFEIIERLDNECEVECPDCEGKGYVVVHCRVCNGSGEGMYDGSSCSACRGGGEVGEECERCDGQGSYWLEHDDSGEIIG